MPDVEWDDQVAYELFRSVGGPVGDLLRQLATEVVIRARAACPRRTGATADSLHTVVGEDSQGVYADAGGSYVLFFLEHPAEQMHRPRRPLTDALKSVAAGSA